MTIKDKTTKERWYHSLKNACENREVGIYFNKSTDTLTLDSKNMDTFRECEDYLETKIRKDI